MNKPLPKIACNKCYRTQEFRGQTDCIHCGRRLNNWSVASQIAIQGQAQKANVQN